MKAKATKKLISILLTAAMLFSLGMPVLAVDSTEEQVCTTPEVCGDSETHAEGCDLYVTPTECEVSGCTLGYSHDGKHDACTKVDVCGETHAEGCDLYAAPTECEVSGCTLGYGHDGKHDACTKADECGETHVEGCDLYAAPTECEVSGCTLGYSHDGKHDACTKVDVCGETHAEGCDLYAAPIECEVSGCTLGYGHDGKHDACTKADVCEETHAEGCDLYAAPVCGNLEGCADGQHNETCAMHDAASCINCKAVDDTLKSIQARIDALPAVKELEGKSLEELKAVQEGVLAISQMIDALPEGTTVDTTKIAAVTAVLQQRIMTLENVCDDTAACSATEHNKFCLVNVADETVTEFTIDSEDDLQAFAAAVNVGATFAGKTVKLTADIDLTDINWTPIGSKTYPFRGTFDGQGHKISNLAVDVSVDGAGLFGVVGGGTHIKNLVVSGNVKTSGKYASGIVGNSSGAGTVTIENCGNEANVTAVGANAAGIIGCNDGSKATFIIKNCYNIGTITGGKESAAISGWLGNSATVRNCWNSGMVNNYQDERYFARYNSAEFINCYQHEDLPVQTDIIAVSTEKMKSGELAANLGSAWGQTIGTDDYPVIGGASVYTIYESGGCKPIGYSNTADGNNVTPIHHETYTNAGKCQTCGLYNPDAIVTESMDFTAKTADASGTSWSWDQETKTLTLDGTIIETDEEFVIKLPDGATVVVNGDVELSSTHSAPKAIWAEGMVTVKGEGENSLTVKTLTGHSFYVDTTENDGGVNFENVKAAFTGEVSINSKNSSFVVENSVLKTHPSGITVKSGENGKTTFKVIGSDINTGAVSVENLNAGRSTTDTITFYVEDTIWYTQCSGANANAIKLTGNAIDVDVIGGYMTLWNSGYGQNWGHAYGMRINGKGITSFNLTDAQLRLYGMHSSVWSDALLNMSDSSAIKNCEIISYAKQAGGELVFNENDSDSNGYGNDTVNITYSDTLIVECSNMELPGNQKVVAEIHGNPVISADYVIPVGLGGVADMMQYAEDFVLPANQTITIADGATLTVEKQPLILEAGAAVVGNFVGTLQAANGAVLVTVNTGDSKTVMSVASENGVPVPETPTHEDKCMVFKGWYDNPEYTGKAYVGGEPLTEAITLYAKWEQVHEWGVWTQQDDTTHIRVCVNNSAHKEEGNHSGGTATTTQQAVCDICGGEYGELAEPTDTEIPKGDSVEVGGTEVTLPDGGTVAPDGTITVPEGGSVEVEGTEAELPNGGTVTVNPDGTVTIDPDGNPGLVDIPDIGVIILPEDGTVTIDPETGKVTIDPADSPIDTDGDGDADVNIDTDYDGKSDVNVDTDGDHNADINIDTDGDEKADVNIDTDGDGEADSNIDVDGDGKADISSGTINSDGSVSVPVGGTVENGGTDVALPDGGKVTVDQEGNLVIDPTTGADGKDEVTVEGIGTVTLPAMGTVTVKPDGSVVIDPANCYIDVDSDGMVDYKTDLNIDRDGNGKPDLNVDKDGNYKLDATDDNVDTDGDGKPNYKVIKGANQVWYYGNTWGLTFTVNGLFEDAKYGFQYVEIDDVKLSAIHYTGKSGSTVVTLDYDYLQTLSAGTHKITVVYPDGEASANFYIREASVVPDTGDNSQIGLWIAVFGVSVVALGIAAALIIKRRKNGEA